MSDKSVHDEIITRILSLSNRKSALCGAFHMQKPFFIGVYTTTRENEKPPYCDLSLYKGIVVMALENPQNIVHMNKQAVLQQEDNVGKERSEHRRTFSNFFRAYSAAFVIVGCIIPILSSAITLALYFTPLPMLPFV